MIFYARSTLAFLYLLLQAGCAPSVNPVAADLSPPRAALMVVPKALSEVKAGEDNYQSNAQCSAEYVRESGKLKSLQTYVRTVLKK